MRISLKLQAASQSFLVDSAHLVIPLHMIRKYATHFHFMKFPPQNPKPLFITSGTTGAAAVKRQRTPLGPQMSDSAWIFYLAKKRLDGSSWVTRDEILSSLDGYSYKNKNRRSSWFLYCSNIYLRLFFRMWVYCIYFILNIAFKWSKLVSV